LKNKKSPSLYRDELLTRGTTLLAKRQASLFRHKRIYALAHDNGSTPARPTKKFSLLLAGVFHEFLPPRRTIPRLSVGFRPLLLPRIAFHFMEKNITPVKKIVKPAYD